MIISSFVYGCLGGIFPGKYYAMKFLYVLHAAFNVMRLLFFFQKLKSHHNGGNLSLSKTIVSLLEQIKCFDFSVWIGREYGSSPDLECGMEENFVFIV